MAWSTLFHTELYSLSATVIVPQCHLYFSLKYSLYAADLCIFRPAWLCVGLAPNSF